MKDRDSTCDNEIFLSGDATDDDGGGDHHPEMMMMMPVGFGA